MDVRRALMRNSGVSSPSLERLPASPPETRGAGLTVDVVVLSADLPLFDAIRAALEDRSPVWRARSPEEAVDLLVTGRCGVLVLDMALVAAEPAMLVERVVQQFPDVVVVVAGRRDDEGLLARLISEGHVYRFMHKPLTAKRAGMFLSAAMRCHAERRGLRAAEQLLPLVPKIAARLDPVKWLFVAAGVAMFITLLSVLSGGDGGNAGVEPAAPPPARPAPRVEPAAVPLADPVLSRARAAFAAGRYEDPPGRNALDLYSAVLLARPNHPEARVGLERTIEQLVALAEQAHLGGRDDEARWLLQRIRAADPDSPAVGRLTALLESMATPLPAPASTGMPEPDVPPPRPAESPPPIAAKSVGAHPAAPPMTESPRKGRVTADPLTPRVTNDEASRVARTGPSARVRQTRVFGPPISSGHPTAGLAGDAQPDSPLVPRTSQEPASVSTLPPTTSDVLERVVAPDPTYPPDALRDGVEGWVELAFTVTETGSVRDIEIVEARPSGVFDAAATQALAQWRFRPRLANGQPVAQRSVVTLRFSVER